ncbi:hypothetical protein AQI95_34005 [Streptomyces yokosukanensis]|uniref:Protein phosphatase n=1 Tax=Streptomyces yokosukanensis TaxID=67386 RepID=A0A117PZS0_9ACTN|nr:hypothetical protein [Streptomyces yokosukanensis]KUN00761.1 hypothetical protein AQI95_34005 [Streptomyces yokosukanensis]
MGDEAKLIDPSGIPHFIGDLATLDTDVMLLTADAGQFRASGSDVHTTFQHLSSFYSAPEAEQLFSTTRPVQKKSDVFAGDLEKVANTLSDYGLEVQPLVKKLDTLKAEATAFVNSVSGDDDWRKDHDKVDHNNDLWHDVNHTVAAFEAAERKAYNKIMALISGTPLTADDGSHSCNMYGFKAADLDHAKETPWGAPAEKEYEGWSWLAHQGKQVWDGFWYDGVVGTVHGLGTLVGWDGADAAGEAWKNLAKLGTGIAMTFGTLGTWGWVPDKDLPSWLRDSRHVLNQTAKGFVAWDQWKTNPGRAAGAFGFNLLTVVGTEGAGASASGAGKAGAAGRTISAVGKVGRAVDPMTYVGKAGKFAFVKVGETFTALKNLHTGVTADLLKQADALRSPKIPDNAIPYVDAKTGELVYLTTKGHVLNADGSLHQRASEAPHELSANDHEVLGAEGNRDHSHGLVGAGARAEHTAGGAHTGERTPSQTGRGDGGHAASHAGSSNRTAGAQSIDRPGGGSGRGGHGSPGRGHGDGAHDERHQELTAAERKAIQDEHVRKANGDPEWRKAHYDTLGRRRPNIGLVDGVQLPQLAKDAQGHFIAKHDLPSGPSEIRFGSKPLPRGTTPDDVLPTLDKRAADRQAYRDLMNAQKAFGETPSTPHHDALTTAQETYDKQLGDVPPNSKISEKLGEDASRLHAIPRTFKVVEVIHLPKTANGANMFDGAYRIKDDEILIAEDKAPGNDLDWRQGRADPEDPANPNTGDDGGAAGMRVKQGTLLYLRTIFGEMAKRGGHDAELAREFRNALKAKKLRYVLVKAMEPDGSLYAGAVVEELKIY